MRSQGVNSRKLTIVLQLVFEFGELRNNALAFGQLLRVFGLANRLVQVVNGTCLMRLSVRFHYILFHLAEPLSSLFHYGET